MRNSSHRPGCMRALPASQSCQVRSVDEMSAAAAVWESPASSLACRISCGDGLEVIFRNFDPHAVVVKHFELGNAVAIFFESLCGFDGGFLGFDGFEGVLSDYFDHDLLRFVVGSHCAPHELHSTRNPCNSKSFLHKFTEALTPPHNARVQAAP